MLSGIMILLHGHLVMWAVTDIRLLIIDRQLASGERGVERLSWCDTELKCTGARRAEVFVSFAQDAGSCSSRIGSWRIPFAPMNHVIYGHGSFARKQRASSRKLSAAIAVDVSLIASYNGTGYVGFEQTSLKGLPSAWFSRRSWLLYPIRPYPCCHIPDQALHATAAASAKETRARKQSPKDRTSGGSQVKPFRDTNHIMLESWHMKILQDVGWAYDNPVYLDRRSAAGVPRSRKGYVQKRDNFESQCNSRGLQGISNLPFAEVLWDFHQERLSQAATWSLSLWHQSNRTGGVSVVTK
nr:hypothetical protein CFP56_11667 [Quercus suber]